GASSGVAGTGNAASALDARTLASGRPAVRRRVLREWLGENGASRLTDARLRQVDALVGRWRGQGGVAVGGGGPDVHVAVVRRHGTLTVVREERGSGDGGASAGAAPRPDAGCRRRLSLQWGAGRARRGHRQRPVPGAAE